MARLSAGAVLMMSVAAVGLPATAHAQSLGDDGANAVPGSQRVGFPHPMPGVATVVAASGYGGRPGVVAADASHHRATAALAGSWRARPWLAVGLRLDGRYDRHGGLGGDSDTDDSWVGDPRLFVRARTSLGHKAALGLHAGLWFPSDSFFAFNGVSPEVRGLASYRLFGELAFAANAGFRLDRSAKTVDAPQRLSDADRFSLGASDANAVLMGAGLMWRRGRATVTADWSLDLLVGSDAPPSSESPMRVGADVRWQLGRSMWLRGGVELGLSSAPPIAADNPLAPVEPRYSAWLGLGYRFGGRQVPKKREADVPPPAPGPVGVVAGGVVAGIVIEGAGVPVQGATVSAGDALATTGADGAFRLKGVTPGELTIEVRADGFRSRTVVVTATDDAAAVGSTTRVRLVADLPPGQIRGLVRTIKGDPIAGASVRVEPLGVEVVSDERGSFRIDVPPGSYSIVVSATGRAQQTRKVLVEEDGVTVLNVELRGGR